MSLSVDPVARLENFPRRPVEQWIIKRASFDPTNTFTPGEIVITSDIAGTMYFYSCVMGSYITSCGYRNVQLIKTIRHFPSHNYQVGFMPVAIW
jgi:hypothetical protein